VKVETIRSDGRRSVDDDIKDILRGIVEWIPFAEYGETLTLKILIEDDMIKMIKKSRKRL